MSNAAAAALAVPAPGPAAPVSAAPAPSPAGSTPATEITEIYRQRAVASLAGNPPSSQPAAPADPGPLPAGSTVPLPPSDPPAPGAGAAPGDDPGENNPSLPHGVREALSSLRADRRSLKAQNEALQAELATLRGTPPAAAASGVQTPGPAAPPAPPTDPAAPAAPPASTDPVAQATEAAQQAEANFTAVNALLRRVRTGDVEGALATLQASQIVPPTTEGPALTEWLEGLKEVYAEQRSDARLELKLLETRAKDQATSLRRQGEAYAVKTMPELAKPDSPQAKKAALLKQAHPWLADDPRGQVLLVHAIRGMELAEQSATTPAPTAGAGTVSRSPASAPAVVVIPQRGQAGAAALPGAPAATLHAPPSGPTSAQLFQKYQQTGSEQDKAAWQASLARDIGRPPAARG